MEAQGKGTEAGRRASGDVGALTGIGLLVYLVARVVTAVTRVEAIEVIGAGVALLAFLAALAVASLRRSAGAAVLPGILLVLLLVLGIARVL
jgi:hypothetical protein